MLYLPDMFPNVCSLLVPMKLPSIFVTISTVIRIDEEICERGYINHEIGWKKVIALVDEEFEDLELWYPVYRVREEGAEVHLAGLEKGKTYTGKYGVPAQAEYSFEELNSKDYDGILVPGGWAPDKPRRYDKVRNW